MMGAILQTVNVRLSPEQVAYTIDHAGSSTLLVNDEFVDLVHSILPKLPKVRQLVVISDRKAPATGALQFIGEYEDLLAAASPDFRFPDFDENVQATTFNTTGTTGLPKGVYYSHRQVVLHVMAELALFGLAAKQGRFHRDDVYMPITPMFHVHAWGFPWAATLAGVKQVYPGRYDPALLIKLIKTEGVTFTHCVPTLLEMLLDAAANANVDLAGLKMLIGGSALPKALAKRAMDRGIDVFAGYGMSETGPLVTVAHLQSSELSGDLEHQIELRVSAGRACPLVDLRIVDMDMRELPHDGASPGEIVVARPGSRAGIPTIPKPPSSLGRRLSSHRRHRSHHARRSPSDHRSHQGRHQVWAVSGFRRSSSRILSCVAHGVAECAVIGVKDPRWGERPLALIVRDPKVAPPVDVEDIKSHVITFSDKGVISKFAVPQKVLFVDALAKTSVGKFDKKALRAQYGEGV